jgi:hypothetical protein
VRNLLVIGYFSLDVKKTEDTKCNFKDVTVSLMNHMPTRGVGQKNEETLVDLVTGTGVMLVMVYGLLL